MEAVCVRVSERERLISYLTSEDGYCHLSSVDHKKGWGQLRSRRVSVSFPALR